MSKIETLLRRHAEGIITPEEQEELNQLTRRDETLRNASLRAKQLRRRASLAFSLVAFIVVGSLFVWRSPAERTSATPLLAAQMDSHDEDSAMTAQRMELPTSLPEPAVQSTPTVVPPSAPSSAEPHKEATPAPRHAAPVQPAAATPEEPLPVAETVPAAPLRSHEPVVACNTACSPDSVISDIWNFLHA